MVNCSSDQTSSLQSAQDSITESVSRSAEQDCWTTIDSSKLYNIKGWGDPYFAISRQGNVMVTTTAQNKPIELLEIVNLLSDQGVDLPLLIRFPDILEDRLARLHQCMEQAIARYNYQGSYQGVFPIKCNQNRQLIETVVERGQQYQLGLEAGSKPELTIALACLKVDRSQAPLLMCNGYKDRQYLETALLATKLGHQPIIVIEQLSELNLLLKIAQELQISPIIGVRAKLNTKGTGRWGSSTGDWAKFGLTVAEILQVVHRLAASEQLGCLQLLHFHIGSQISAIKTIKNAIREASQIYVQLAKLGANMQYLNVGGGLAVDYDGSKTDVPASKNYNMQNYANDIVAQVKDACDRLAIKHPILVSESGRAIASHQSVLIFDVLGQSQIRESTPSPPEATAPLVIKNFWETYQGINLANLQESYHDAIQFKQEALSLFNLGYLSLVERSHAEELFWGCCRQINRTIEANQDLPDELASLPQMMASTYYINLSIFRSIPDSWAIDQLFPILPIHRLQEKPTVKAVLADITCDSDGKVDQFIDRKITKETLELHALNSPTSSPYYIGMFLVGAYQEIMGNLHNLFGDTNVVQIESNATGYAIKSVIPGDTIAKVLKYVEHNSQDLLRTIECQIQSALQQQNITKLEAQKLRQNYANTLNSYTYLKSSAG
ncbi:MAG: biosynthetic arginine decarboxylase [Cyanobacteria bacterium J06600_6]